MADFDYNTRREFSEKLKGCLEARIQKLSGDEKALAEEISRQYNGYHVDGGELVRRIIKQFRGQKGRKLSGLFRKEGRLPGKPVYGGLLDAFVPPKYQESYLYIIDKLNQFPFTSGWHRRTVRTREYWAQVGKAFYLLNVYEKLFYCGDDLTDFIYRRLDEEMLDHIKNRWNFTRNFSLVYAAEIDRGNQKVIDALKDLILSENNTAYLDREMILGILQSDNKELHKLICDLLLAARLQEGLRQVICETMDEGTCEAFMELLKVIEDNDLIRYSSVKRAVSVWIGIFDEKSVDRVNRKLLGLMGQCLREGDFCREQLKSNDSIAISVALWALGFEEAENAVEAMMELIDHGTKNQKLTASCYNASLFDEELRIQAAKKAILEHEDDLELAAAFMPVFNERLSGWINTVLYKGSNARRNAAEPGKPVLTDYYQNREEAELQYKKFWCIYENLPKKGVLYDPCIFPWHRVEMKPSEIVRQLAFLAYMLEDEEKITKMAGLLGEVSTDGYGSDRANLLNLLLYSPANETQRKLLITYMGNAEESTSARAIEIVKKLTLQKEDFSLMEDMLRFKRGKLKNQLLEFMMLQEDEDMEGCLKRLLKDKNEEKRSAGLDLMLRLAEEKAELYAKVRVMAAEIENPTDKERVLLEEILGEDREKASAQKGYGLYDPDAEEVIPELEEKNDAILQCVALPEQEIINKLKKLDAIFQKNKDLEYQTASGEKQLLCNGYTIKKLEKGSMPEGFYQRRRLEYYPLEQELQEFYEKEIGSYAVFMEMEARLYWTSGVIYQNGDARKMWKSVLGRLPFEPLPLQLEYPKHVEGVMTNYHYEFLDKGFLFKAGLQAVAALGKFVNKDNKCITFEYTGWNGQGRTGTASVGSLRFINRFMEGLNYWDTDEEFIKAFYTAWNFELNCAEDRERSRFHTAVNFNNAEVLTPMPPYWFLKAYHMGLISRDIVYKAVLNYYSRKNCLQAITQLVKGEYGKPSNWRLWNCFFGQGMGQKMKEQGEELAGKDTWCGRLVRELYDAIVPMVMDTELRRGEAPTEFSEDIGGITYIRGIDYLIRILMALGNDTLSRETYYSWYYVQGKSRKGALSYLLKSSYPSEGDNGAVLKQKLKGTSIKADRLVEVAMYAPQWIDVIEEYFGWKGLKSGCYYFMAHMDERFDEHKKAMIARYTPLSPEELQRGAFDIDWFREVYEMLGEKNFGLLYKAAKYISNGQKHSRARKYADAASGKVTTEELLQQIVAKRNKDLLMSYGLVPFAKDREKDMLARYNYIQQFAKEAKQFGSQRRVSEAEAAQTALVNLSVHAGFADVTRLILNMESRLAQEYASFMEWHAVEDVEVCLQIDEAGKSAVLCRKEGKQLKSVPARLGKQAYVLDLKEANKKLKEQYSRTKKMMEESMESGEEFTAAEVEGLLGNAVVGAILKPLVFVLGENPASAGNEADKGSSNAAGALGSAGNETNGRIGSAAVNTRGMEGDFSGGAMGFPELEKGKLALRSWDGSVKVLKAEDKLRIAHPLDLYRAQIWHSFQKYLFDRQICQPFKQVFRELYVKMPEELGLRASRMFAGNQIQPQKTLGCLKGRRWIADYEEGLQKIYYKENIVARIYALADWFSPSDVEAPTLEWVEFSDRKSFEPLTIEQVPDLIYSEVMRDVDLAVSVAHAGGVDPETSHSTIEMRRAIVELNLPLFKIENVTLKDSHALIKGTRGNYNVHLGSGVVHQEGGTMLNILPVHSQKRGKLFLPFVDEDPKTAEIMSKIVLLAEDKKIRDPFILDQIHGN